MRLLVTGGAGFIGSNLVHHLFHTAGAPTDCCPDHARYPDAPSGAWAEDGLEVLNVDLLTYAGDPANLAGVDHLPGYRFLRADVCDGLAVDRAISDFEPDAVLHVAAESHVDRSIEAGDVFVRTNVLGTQTLLDAVRRHDVPAFLQVSTDEVYGSIREGSFTEDDPYHAGSPYAASKAGGDLLVLAHHNTYGIPATVTRCTNNFGPRQHSEKLLPKVAALAAAGQPLPIYGDGRNVRDWLYVKDHCAAILHVFCLRDWGGVYNVAARDERTNLDVIHRVLDHLGRSPDLITFVPDRPGHDWRYSLDDAKLRATGWAPHTHFEQGLSDTFRWLDEIGAVAA